jgi:hypothetical protein
MASRLKRNNGTTPPRSLLAEAIQARDTAQDDLTKATVALEAAQRGTWSAQDALEQAEKSLVEARDAAGTSYAEYLLAGEKPNGNAGLREARLALAAAEDTLAGSPRRALVRTRRIRPGRNGRRLQPIARDATAALPVISDGRPHP